MASIQHKIFVPLHKYKEFLQKITDKDSITQSGAKFVFRCPICGDSSNNTFKKRGWLLTNNDGHATMGCLNCDYKDSFYNTLKKIYPDLFKAWIAEVYFMNGMNEIIKIEEPVPTITPIDYSKFLPLREKSEFVICESVRKKAIEFIKHRRIPKKIAKNFLYCAEYEENKYSNRVIIPHYLRDGNFKYFEARDLTDKSFMKYKYPTGLQQETYNLNFVDKNIHFFVFEGTIDSLFVNNSIACGGASKFRTLLKTIDKKYHKNLVLFFDGDRDGIKASYQALRSGISVFVWSDEMMELRDKIKNKIDLNQLVMTGYCDAIIDENGQIPYEYIIKHVMKPTLQNLLAFEMHYAKFGFSMEDGNNDRSFQAGRWHSNNRTNR